LLSRQHCRTKLAHGITDLGKGLLRPFQFTLERVALDYDGAEYHISGLKGFLAQKDEQRIHLAAQLRVLALERAEPVDGRLAELIKRGSQVGIVTLSI
jgi:hypothetical protein